MRSPQGPGRRGTGVLDAKLEAERPESSLHGSAQDTLPLEGQTPEGPWRTWTRKPGVVTWRHLHSDASSKYWPCLHINHRTLPPLWRGSFGCPSFLEPCGLYTLHGEGPL